jgi:hypothetical protein
MFYFILFNLDIIWLLPSPSPSHCLISLHSCFFPNLANLVATFGLHKLAPSPPLFFFSPNFSFSPFLSQLQEVVGLVLKNLCISRCSLSSPRASHPNPLPGPSPYPSTSPSQAAHEGGPKLKPNGAREENEREHLLGEPPARPLSSRAPLPSC